MFPGTQHYPEGRFKPERGGGCNWHVWCSTGALQVLRGGEFAQLLKEHPDREYIINFANGSGADILSGHPLWEILAGIAETHAVEVFPLPLSTRNYVPWTGAVCDLGRFDAIRIRSKIRPALAASTDAERV